MIWNREVYCINIYGEDFPKYVHQIVGKLFERLSIPKEKLQYNYDGIDFISGYLINLSIEKKIDEIFFEENYLGLIAYMGECYIQTKGGKWEMILDKKGNTWEPYIQKIDGKLNGNFIKYIYDCLTEDEIADYESCLLGI